MSMMEIDLGIALTVVVLYLLSCIRVLTEYERGSVPSREAHRIRSNTRDGGGKRPVACLCPG